MQQVQAEKLKLEEQTQLIQNEQKTLITNKQTFEEEKTKLQEEKNKIQEEKEKLAFAKKMEESEVQSFPFSEICNQLRFTTFLSFFLFISQNVSELKELIFQMKEELVQVKQQMKERDVVTLTQQLTELKQLLQQDRERIRTLEESYQKLITDKNIELLIKQKVIEELKHFNEILLSQFNQFQNDMNARFDSVEKRMNETLRDKLNSIVQQSTQNGPQPATFLEPSKIEQLEQNLLATVEKKFQALFSGPAAQKGNNQSQSSLGFL
jgi:hypothetical protein